MKKTIITIALIAGFIGTAGTASAANNGKPVSCAPPSCVAGSAYGLGNPGGIRPNVMWGCAPMKQTLGLTDSQELKMVEIRQHLVRKSLPVMHELRHLKQHLAHESVSKSPDKRKIDALARKIGQAHARLAELQSSHLHKVASVLDSKQLDTFMQMKAAPYGRHWKRG